MEDQKTEVRCLFGNPHGLICRPLSEEMKNHPKYKYAIDFLNNNEIILDLRKSENA